MKRKIAVEQSLMSVHDFFISQGYSVDVFNSQEIVRLKSDDYDAIVIAGGNKDFMGMSDITVEVPVIDATGISPQAIYGMISKRSEI